MSGVRPVTQVRVGVAVPAAGSGQRMGGVRKPFLELAGEPVLLHALRPFLSEPRVVAVAVALADPDAAAPPAWLTGLAPRIRVLGGGATRSDSVRRALDALPDDVDVVAVHDAARPLVSPEVVAQCIDIAAAGEGAVAGSPAVDTMKQVDAEGCIVATPQRRALWHAHTPQAFPARPLRMAYRGDLSGLTDDASLMERHGLTVRMVDDGAANLKVTTPADLIVAEALLRLRAEGR
ncbi:MAG: 2-C-methyl-D-erythritol 4-phosphate cytidylyltransferase [Gemmatimonadetes bacterium]|nr:2-C-methyl-D-erythritol 4-phosphate cytidylyltransferase [Gemmatimonadota bacterium]